MGLLGSLFNAVNSGLQDAALAKQASDYEKYIRLDASDLRALAETMTTTSSKLIIILALFYKGDSYTAEQLMTGYIDTYKRRLQSLATSDNTRLSQAALKVLREKSYLFK